MGGACELEGASRERVALSRERSTHACMHACMHARMHRGSCAASVYHALARSSLACLGAKARSSGPVALSCSAGRAVSVQRLRPSSGTAVVRRCDLTASFSCSSPRSRRTPRSSTSRRRSSWSGPPLAAQLQCLRVRLRVCAVVHLRAIVCSHLRASALTHSHTRMRACEHVRTHAHTDAYGWFVSALARATRTRRWAASGGRSLRRSCRSCVR